MNETKKKRIEKQMSAYANDSKQLADFFSLIHHDHFNEGNCFSVKYHPNCSLGSLEISNMCFEVNEDGRMTNFPRPAARASMELCFINTDQLRKMANLLSDAADYIDVLNKMDIDRTTH